MSERVTARTGASVRAYHEARYHFATQYASRLRVLDVACGDGYGSMILGSVAASVVSVDPAAEPAHPVQAHLRAYAEELVFDREFDLVVSFETLEHTISPRVFLQSLWKCLKPSGRLVVSFPNAWGESEFHLHDTNAGTVGLVAEFFDIEGVYGQNRANQVTPVLLGRPAQFWVENMIIVARRKDTVPAVRVFAELYREARKKQRGIVSSLPHRVTRFLPRLLLAFRRRWGRSTLTRNT